MSLVGRWRMHQLKVDVKVQSQPVPSMHLQAYDIYIYVFVGCCLIHWLKGCDATESQVLDRRTV